MRMELVNATCLFVTVFSSASAYAGSGLEFIMNDQSVCVGKILFDEHYPPHFLPGSEVAGSGFADDPRGNFGPFIRVFLWDEPGLKGYWVDGFVTGGCRWLEGIITGDVYQEIRKTYITLQGELDKQGIHIPDPLPEHLPGV